MNVNPGKLPHKITVYRPTESVNPDPRGDEQLGQEQVAQLWASIEPLMGRELQFAQQMHGSVSHRIKTRYKAALTKRMWCIWNSRRFNFGPPLSTEERNYEIVLYATEVI